VQGGTRTAEFVAKNPNGKIPVLELLSGEHLAESNAILYYLAEGTRYWPTDRLARARVLQWQNFEQYSHEPYVAVARFIAKYLGLPEARRAEFEAKTAGGYKALGVMEQHLQANRYFVGATPTIADISLYAYTHVADEGGFSLERFPAVRRWLAAMAAEPGHVSMQAS
jgi:glutathione S-transferase